MKIITKRLREHKQLKTYKVPQGSCTDGKYIYVAYEQKPTHGKKHRIKIAKYDKSGKLKKVSGAMKLGHANDMTYHDGILYVTHSGNDNIIHRVRANTLKPLKGVKVRFGKIKKTGFNGIGKTADGFILRRMGGGLLLTDNNFKAKKAVKCVQPKSKSPQGITVNKDRLYRGYANFQKGQNSVVEYDLDGTKLRRIVLDVKGELESIFFLNGKLNLIIYRKYRKSGKNHYEAWLVR